MEDRLQRQQVQTPMSQLRAPVGGRDGTTVPAEGQVVTEDKNPTPSTPNASPAETTPQIGKLQSNVTITKYNTPTDPVLVETALPASDLRKGIPTQEPLAHDKIPAINLKGLVDADPHHQQGVQHDANIDRVKHDQQKVQENILRNAYVEKDKEAHVERDLKTDVEERKDSNVSSRIKDQIEKISDERSNQSIHVDDARSTNDKPALTSFRDEPTSVFKSEVLEKHDSRADLKNISISHERDVAPADLRRDHQPTSDINKNQIPQQRDQQHKDHHSDAPKIDLLKSDGVKLEQKPAPQRNDQISHEPSESKLRSDAPKPSSSDLGKQNLETRERDPKQHEQKTSSDRPVEKVQEPIHKDVTHKITTPDQKHSDPKTTEPIREVHSRIKDPEVVKTSDPQPRYREEPTPIRITEQRVETDKAPSQHPTDLQKEIPKEIVREQHAAEPLAKSPDAEVAQNRTLTLEDRIEKIIVPDIAQSESVVSREQSRREEIIIDQVNKEAYLEKDLVSTKEDGEPIIAREVLRGEEQQSRTIELNNIVEEAAGIVVEKEGPHASSGGSGEASQAIVLEHEALDQIVDQINEVTPTVSTSEGMVLSEVRGVISEIIRINDAQLATGREPQPEEIARLEALSEQLRGTISQAVDELTRKVDKSYDEVVLLNELRVLLSELSRDPLIQLGLNTDEQSLFESRETQKPPPQNMLEKAYDSVKEVVTRFLGFGGDEKLPEKQELPPPIIILKDKDIALLEKLEQEEIEEEIRKELDEEEMESQASRSVHVLSGEIINSATGAGLAGVSVYGGLLGVAITDESGRFYFQNVQHGTSFMIGPDKHGYKFSPSVVSGTMLNSEHYTFTANKVR